MQSHRNLRKDKLSTGTADQNVQPRVAYAFSSRPAQTHGSVHLPRPVDTVSHATRRVARVQATHSSDGNPATRASRIQALQTKAEELLEALQDQQAPEEDWQEEDEAVHAAGGSQQMQDRMNMLQEKAQKLSQQIDEQYNVCFAGLSVTVPISEEPAAQASDGATEETKETLTITRVFDSMTEARFAALGREEPEVLFALLEEKQEDDPEGWTRFQGEVGSLKLQRGRIEREVAELSAALQEAARRAAVKAEAAARSAAAPATPAAAAGGRGLRPVRMVLMTGFESFNVDLYRQVAKRIKAVAPHITLTVFSDRELKTEPGRMRVEAALANADVFFGSLLFDFDEVEWLRSHLDKVPVKLVFESALELMSCTKVGSFSMASSPGEKKGPPPVVKKVLSLFGSQREEDKMVGYLAFLKMGPKLLKWVPGKKAADLKRWLTIYGYWNQGGVSNVQSMVLYIVDELVQPLPQAATQAALISPPVETPPLGCLHPSYKDGKAYFNSPAQYWAWYQKEGALRGTDAPVVGVMLYRKHVITDQPYVLQLISQLEKEGIIPVPVFINGVEAHTVVRDMLTSSCEQKALAQGKIGGVSPTLARDAVRVDAVISTIGFPLVGGPAGTMEGGRQADIAKTILSTKNIPYVVAAPLLIQDMASWSRDGVAGLQSVVLYGLPELDGAVDTVPLGGLVGDNIYLVPERVKKVAQRLNAWVRLRRKKPSERRVAVLLYGFPPGVGAVGTAALLNVPKSLQLLLKELQADGYDLGNVDLESLEGEALVAALAGQDTQRAVMQGAAGIKALGAGEAEAAGFTATAADVSPQTLKAWLTYPPEWGPTEWGPIPFLPDNDVLVKNMQRQWGDLNAYRGIMTSATHHLVVPGLQAGNVFIGVQPVLGVEGDPMRLLFERDLTPHPQYAAFYKWLQKDFKADVVLHFGMHGTVEWLPGAPLGNTGFSWSDVLLGEMPNVYVYACNNPSESIIAKRRGYGTIISHNVPPYGRAGLYKQLATLKDLITEWRETHTPSGKQPQQSATEGTSAMAAAAAAGASVPSATQSAGEPQHGVEDSVRATIFSNIQLAGLQDDVPFFPKHDSKLWAVAKQAAEQAAAAAAAQQAAAAAHPTKPSASAAPHAKTLGSPLSSITHAASTAVSQVGSHAGELPAKPGKSGKKGAGAAPTAHTKITGPPPGSLPLTEQLIQAMTDEEWAQYLSDVYAYLQVLENRLFSEGLHVLGQPPSRSGLVQYLSAYFNEALPTEALEMVADATPADNVEVLRAKLERAWQQEPAQKPTSPPSPSELTSKLEEALRIKDLLGKNTEEMHGVMKALRGEYILPEAGGDLLRDGAGVLPTGRNIHALDPYRMPSPAALDRGVAAAQAIIDNHQATNNGAYPETVAINLWGLDAIKTKGESVAMVLHMVGARPIREGTGRIARFELIPLEELGRPRIDVLCNMSGIFRDSFQNVVELLDDLFQRAAAVDEPIESNFIRKHAQAMSGQGIDNPAARLFSNPAGDYGSMVNERVGAGNWDNGNELGDTWVSRNAFSYGKAGERGAARPEVLCSLLGSTQRIVQQIDSVEYGLTDIQEYYANTGALARAAANAQGGSRVGVSVVEAFSKDPAPKELDEVLRLEYRSKLLNPKWAEAMAAQGSGGAYEISQRMTAMVGWGATSGFSESWVWDQAAQTYALDPEMADKLKKANPQAFSNVVKRMLEASGRGMWRPNQATIHKLRRLYGEMDDQLEGIDKPYHNRRRS